MARVTLRPIRMSDAEVCFRWVSDPDVIRYLGLLQPPATVEAERAWIAGVLADKVQQQPFAIEDEQGRTIGTCGLRGIDRQTGCAHLGLLIGEKRLWGRGYGTAATQALLDHAFQTLGLREVRLSCHPDNRRALRCYHKVGFKISKIPAGDSLFARAEVRMVIDRQTWEQLRGSERA